MFSFISKRRNELKIEGSTIYTTGILAVNQRDTRKDKKNPFKIEIVYPLKEVILHFKTREKRNSVYETILKKLNKPLGLF